MRLSDLMTKTKPDESVVIQCHNAPDADTIASAFAIYKYLEKYKRDARIIYSGEQKITKPNLRLMIDRLSIPIEYVEDMQHINTLLLVDCQYGGTNVKELSADNIYVIDHHIELRQPTLPHVTSFINNQLGSCSTIIWDMLNDERFDFAAHTDVSTALYYGLFTDTSSLTEVRHPLDRDMLDDLKFDKFIIDELKHNNVTPSEMKIIGAAISTYLHNPDTRYTILRADECDPTILAIIGDMAMQMQDSGVCIVYNSSTSGLRVSVRSSLRDVNAGEFAEFIANGGGHVQKAGGFITTDTVFKSGLSAPEYLEKRIQEYFNAYDVIDAKKYNLDLLQNKYKKKRIPVGYMLSTEVFSEGTPLIIRTLEGDSEVIASKDRYIMIGVFGEVYSMRATTFEKIYSPSNQASDRDPEDMAPGDLFYLPTIRNKITGESKNLKRIRIFAKTCTPKDEAYIYAKPLEKKTKLIRDGYSYMNGEPGDFIACRSNVDSVFIINRKVFEKTYDRIISD